MLDCKRTKHKSRQQRTGESSLSQQRRRGRQAQFNKGASPYQLAILLEDVCVEAESRRFVRDKMKIQWLNQTDDPLCYVKGDTYVLHQLSKVYHKRFRWYFV